MLPKLIYSEAGPINSLLKLKFYVFRVYSGLGHKVFKFLSSPVLYLRNVASSAYIALIPLQSLTDTIQSLGQQLSDATTNQQHGLLCCLQKLTMHDTGYVSIMIWK